MIYPWVSPLRPQSHTPLAYIHVHRIWKIHVSCLRARLEGANMYENRQNPATVNSGERANDLPKGTASSYKAIQIMYVRTSSAAGAYRM